MAATVAERGHRFAYAEQLTAPHRFAFCTVGAVANELKVASLLIHEPLLSVWELQSRATLSLGTPLRYKYA